MTERLKRQEQAALNISPFAVPGRWRTMIEPAIRTCPSGRPSSSAAGVKMSFEFKFALNPDGSSDGEQLVTAAANGLEVHLSPELGLVPEPSSSLLMLLSGGLLLARRCRED